MDILGILIQTLIFLVTAFGFSVIREGKFMDKEKFVNILCLVTLCTGTLAMILFLASLFFPDWFVLFPSFKYISMSIGLFALWFSLASICLGIGIKWKIRINTIANTAPNVALKKGKMNVNGERDKCQFCLGVKGGKPGNENVIDGVVTCDYCQALITEIDAEREKEENADNG